MRQVADDAPPEAGPYVYPWTEDAPLASLRHSPPRPAGTPPLDIPEVEDVTL